MSESNSIGEKALNLFTDKQYSLLESRDRRELRGWAKVALGTMLGLGVGVGAAITLKNFGFNGREIAWLPGSALILGGGMTGFGVTMLAKDRISVRAPSLPLPRLRG